MYLCTRGARGAWRARARARARICANPRALTRPLGDGGHVRPVLHHRHTAHRKQGVRCHGPHTPACDSCTPRAQSEHTCALKPPIDQQTACLHSDRPTAMLVCVRHRPFRSALPPVAAPSLSPHAAKAATGTRSHCAVGSARCHPLQPCALGSRLPFASARVPGLGWGSGTASSSATGGAALRAPSGSRCPLQKPHAYPPPPDPWPPT